MHRNEQVQRVLQTDKIFMIYFVTDIRIKEDIGIPEGKRLNYYVVQNDRRNLIWRVMYFSSTRARGPLSVRILPRWLGRS